MDNEIKQNEYGHFRKALQEEITVTREIYTYCDLCYFVADDIYCKIFKTSLKNQKACVDCDKRIKKDEFYIDDIGAKNES